MRNRTVKAQHIAHRDDIADLVTRRPLPGPNVDHLDPFLFLNHHGPQTYAPGNHGLPFGPHPHRGFETVTFILEGELSHQDSGGHESIIKEGGIQWMTAGRGLVHSELSSQSFKDKGGPLEILQLWVNLPSRLKMVDPHYVGLQRDDIPVVASDDGLVQLQLIAGEYGDHVGPFESLTGLFMSTLHFKAGGKLALPAAKDENVFLYVVRGSVQVAGAPVKPFHLIELNDDGDCVELSAQSDAVVLFGHGRPYHEPIVAHGPFVMNSEAEIRQAFADYRAGKLGAL